jgi:carbon-monoxide dehydrogenase medium subunit
MSLRSAPAFIVARTVEDALAALSAPGPAPTLLSGGTHVMSRLNGGAARETIWVDISSIAGFSSVSISPSETILGPGVTYAHLLDSSDRGIPVLLKQIACGITGGPQIRNQGTIGGSACHANPGSDMPTGLVALRARMDIASQARGARSVPAADFFAAPFKTVLQPDEMLTAIAVKSDAPGDRWGYYKLKSAESSWPVAVAAAHLRDRSGSGCELSVTIGAATAVPASFAPVQLKHREHLLPEEASAIRHAVHSAAVDWWSDELGDAAYRRRVAGSIAVRAVEAAMSKRSAHG